MLLPYAVVLRIKSLITPIAYEPTGHETPLFDWLISWVDSPIEQSVLSVFLVFVQAVTVNRIVIKNRISTEQSLVPGVMYVLFGSMIPAFLVLSPQLVSATFILAATSNLFKIYGKKATASHTFNIGVLISFASLIYYPTIIFLMIGVIGFVMLKSIKLKGLLQLFIASFFPYYLLYVFYFYTDNIEQFHSYYTDNFTWINDLPTIFNGPYFTFTFILGLTGMVIVNYTNFIKAKSIQTQEKIDLLYMYLLLFVVSSFLIGNYSDAYLFLTIGPIGILFTLWLLRIKRSIIVELVHLGLLILLFGIHFYL